MRCMNPGHPVPRQLDPRDRTRPVDKLRIVTEHVQTLLPHHLQQLRSLQMRVQQHRVGPGDQCRNHPFHSAPVIAAQHPHPLCLKLLQRLRDCLYLGQQLLVGDPPVLVHDRHPVG